MFYLLLVVVALRGAATLKARALKEVWNIAAVIPVEKGTGGGSGNGNGSNGSSNGSFSGELVPEENFLGICSRELLARGCELLKRTRKGKLFTYYDFVYPMTAPSDFQFRHLLFNPSPEVVTFEFSGITSEV